MTTKTIQMTLDEELLADVDRAKEALAVSRSALIRAAIQDYLRDLRTQALERQHADGYARRPQELDEVEEWQHAREWGDP